MNNKPKSCVVLCSGNGSNLGPILDLISKKELAIQIVSIISNNPDSNVLKLAQMSSIRPEALPVGKERDSRLLSLIKEICPDFILLTGYLKKIPKELTSLYANKILNIHPSLLPKYGGKGMYGLHVHTAVLNAKEKVTGATVHLVNEVYDDGEIILQETVNISENETPQSLAKKVLEVENLIYPKAIKIFLNSILK